jgi:hypothetical protein
MFSKIVEKMNNSKISNSMSKDRMNRWDSNNRKDKKLTKKICKTSNLVKRISRKMRILMKSMIECLISWTKLSQGWRKNSLENRSFNRRSLSQNKRKEKYLLNRNKKRLRRLNIQWLHRHNSRNSGPIS